MDGDAVTGFERGESTENLAFLFPPSLGCKYWPLLALATRPVK